LIDAVHRTAGHADFAQPGDPEVAWVRVEALLQDRRQLLAVHKTLILGHEAFVAGKVDIEHPT
jgi:hypothetical protein